MPGPSSHRQTFLAILWASWTNWTQMPCLRCLWWSQTPPALGWGELAPHMAVFPRLLQSFDSPHLAGRRCWWSAVSLLLSLSSGLLQPHSAPSCPWNPAGPRALGMLGTNLFGSPLWPMPARSHHLPWHSSAGSSRAIPPREVLFPPASSPTCVSHPPRNLQEVQ